MTPRELRDEGFIVVAVRPKQLQGPAVEFHGVVGAAPVLRP